MKYFKNNNKYNNFYFNSISFDIEEWYHANYDDVAIYNFQNKTTNLEGNVDRLIDVCEKYKVKSTCFVLGTVARDKPEIVRKLHDAGHEIASHGFFHKLVYSMTEKEFLDDLKQSKDVLEDITGVQVKGFRAPSWSIREDILDWYYSVLEQAGFVYSSSVYPAYTYLYGIPGFPQKAHYPEVNGNMVNILEIPVPVFGAFNKYVGYSGGFYLRFFPAWFIKYLLSRANSKGQSTFIYLHPREIDINQPHLSLNMLESFIHYFGINGCEKKLDNILSSISESCIPISEGITKTIIDQH
jgi:polysaccharide deacetylase family protein (PEP-CTERM system associated)